MFFNINQNSHQSVRQSRSLEMKSHTLAAIIDRDVQQPALSMSSYTSMETCPWTLNLFLNTLYTKLLHIEVNYNKGGHESKPRATNIGYHYFVAPTHRTTTHTVGEKLYSPWKMLYVKEMTSYDFTGGNFAPRPFAFDRCVAWFHHCHPKFF